MNMHFWDIESLSNVFSLSDFRYNDKTNEAEVDIYVLSDNRSLTQDIPGQIPFLHALSRRVWEKNANFRGRVNYYDLHDLDANIRLAKTFGLSNASIINNPKDLGTYPKEFRLVCDTDPAYKKKPDEYPYFAGYNSYNYDTTMLAIYFDERFAVAMPQSRIARPINALNDSSIKFVTLDKLRLSGSLTAAMMRSYNNDLFTDAYKDQMPSYLADDVKKYNSDRWKIRKNMLLSGRHIDVARLNEKQRKVGLKRLLGMLGYQILESDKLATGQDRIDSVDQLLDLLAYNVSDVVNLAMLFKHRAYQAQFSLKKGLLETYPELVYSQKANGEYKPDIRPEAVRRDRLTIDSSSAQFATKSLCPYGHLHDMDTVSFLYPAKEKAEEMGIKQVDVLEELKEFFYGLYPADENDTPARQEARRKFDNIYNFYASIRGKNFNGSQNYEDDHAEYRTQKQNEWCDDTPIKQYSDPIFHVYDLAKDIKKTDTCIPYYDKDANPTSCFALFSTGGVHGAEYNKELYDADMEAYEKQAALMNAIMAKYPDPCDFRAACINVPENIHSVQEAEDAIPDHIKALIAEADRLKTSLRDIAAEKAAQDVAAFKDKVRRGEEVLFPNGQEIKKTALDALRTMLSDEETGSDSLSEKEKTLAQKLLTQFAKASATLRKKELEERKSAVNETIRPYVKVPGKKVLVYVMDDGTYLPANTILAKQTLTGAVYRDVNAMKPELFQFKDDGSTKLNPKYTYTSADPSNHEDFTSYYPNLLRMMRAFWNDGLGYDRYEEIFNLKQTYGVEMKDKSKPAEERDRLKTLREGTKLVLNSASGAGDATFESNIRMNNTIIAMRCIGQMFSWRIGQAQTYAGAKITSTNTDGLYSVMEEEENNRILAKESKDIGVEIEPEPMYLISKDTNNRIEMTERGGKIMNASGGTLACNKGPDPTKALAHPAIIDWALCEYLSKVASGEKGLSLDKPFNVELGWQILKSAEEAFPNEAKRLNMFQNILASSPGSVNYIYGVDETTDEPIVLPHFNRVFIMKNRVEGQTMKMRAANAKAITPAMIHKRERDGQVGQQTDPTAVYILQANGVTEMPHDKDIVSKKITGIEETWHMLRENGDLYYLPKDRIQFILNNLDYEKYLALVCDSYEKNWRNHLPGGADATVIGTGADAAEEAAE